MGIPKSFSGGIELFSFKSTTPRDIKNSHIPKYALIPWVQHRGESGIPLVSLGAMVQEDQVLVQGDGLRSASIHSPIPGKIEKIIPYTTWNGITTKAFLISLGGEFSRLGKESKPQPLEDISYSFLIDKIKDLGLIDAQGYPLGQEVDRAPGDIERVVINSIPKEPFLKNEELLLRNKWENLIQALSILKRVLPGVKLAWLYTQGDKYLFNNIKRRANSVGLKIEFHPFKDRYPQGDRDLLSRQLSYNKDRTVMIDTITLNTLFDAWLFDKPITDKIISITGKDCSQVSRKVKMGTSLKDFLQECGFNHQDYPQIVIGGPFRGAKIDNVDIPITKDINNIFLGNSANEGEELPCIHCGWCIHSCPSQLNPGRLSLLLDSAQKDSALDEGLDLCSLCGICDYLCPSNIPLIKKFQDALHENS